MLKNGLLLAALAALLCGCNGFEHSACPNDPQSHNVDRSGVKAALETCN